MVARLMQETRESGGPSKVEWILILSEIRKVSLGDSILSPFMSCLLVPVLLQEVA